MRHVLTAMGLSRKQARCSLRLTLNEENTAEEVDYIARQLSAAVERLRGCLPGGRKRRRAEKTFCWNGRKSDKRQKCLENPLKIRYS